MKYMFNIYPLKSSNINDVAARKLAASQKDESCVFSRYATIIVPVFEVKENYGLNISEAVSFKLQTVVRSVVESTRESAWTEMFLGSYNHRKSLENPSND